MELPPGAEEVDGQIVRRVKVVANDGKEFEQLRPVSLSSEEARAKRRDYYHPELGWILEGYKLERDRDVEDIVRDTTSATAKRPD